MKRQTHACFVILLCSCLVSGALAADPFPPSVLERLEPFDRSDSPGCVVGIIRGGELVFTRGFGSSNLDYEVNNSAKTVFEIGSMAKSFTCACIALLMDEGRIDRNDDVRRYVPELHPFDPPVRIKHLIRCRSGLWAQWHLTQLAGWSAQPVEGYYDESDLLTLLSGQTRLPFQPGAEFRYGTSDYFLLGLIVKRVSGKTLDEFARERFFGPFGMDDTFIMDDPTRVVKKRAIGYHRKTGGEWRQWLQGSSAPGGRGVYTTVEDLARWDKAFRSPPDDWGPTLRRFLADGALLDNRNCLDARPTGEYRGRKRIQFTGGMPGYSAAMTRFPEDDITFICLCNTTEIQPWEINAKLADHFLKAKFSKPAKTKDIDADARELEKPTSITPESAAPLLGAYRLRGDERIWQVVLEDGKLFVVEHLGDRFPLRPRGDNRFQPIGGFFDKTARFVFTREAESTLFSLSVRWSGGSLQTDRVTLVRPNARALNEYAGLYYSEPLKLYYRIRAVGDRLQLRVNNRGWEPLDPTVRDEFVPGKRQNHDNRILRFGRDPHGAVTGLRLSLWRIKDEVLKRVESATRTQ